MSRLIIAIATVLGVLAVLASAQTPNIAGPWYGTIKPGGSPLEVSVMFQSRADGWSGALLIADGRSIPLKDIRINGNSVSFALDVPQANATFAGTLSRNGNESSGGLAQHT